MPLLSQQLSLQQHRVHHGQEDDPPQPHMVKESPRWINRRCRSSCAASLKLAFVASGDVVAVERCVDSFSALYIQVGPSFHCYNYMAHSLPTPFQAAVDNEKYNLLHEELKFRLNLLAIVNKPSLTWSQGVLPAGDLRHCIGCTTTTASRAC